jgi:hypothetical protein
MVKSNENPLLGKATSQESKEQEPNPYNQKKDYLDYDKLDKAAETSFADANTLVVKKDRPKVVVSTMRPEEDTPTEPTEPEDQPYKKVDYKKRYDDLKKHYDGRVNSFKTREDELLAEVRSNRPKYKSPKSSEELAAFKKEYPDVYGVVESVSHLQASKETEDLKEEIKSLKKTNESISRQEAETRLSRLHPDFTEIRESDDFHSWATSQPEQIKGWIYGNNADATLASRAIDLFKQDTGKSKQQSEVSGDLIPASEMIKVTNTKDIGYGTKKIWTRSQIAAMSQSEFAKNEGAIEEAQRNGRVVNDMSRNYGGSGNPTY